MDSFAEDVRKGLSSEKKFLLSKYFYDAQGSQLFKAIMNLKEYYPTRCEYEILSFHKANILSDFLNKENFFELIELGAGDGFKTKILLNYFVEEGVNFKYMPIDISASALKELEESLRKEIPGLNIEGICDEYFKAMLKLKLFDHHKKVILFLGSTIGNFSDDEAFSFLKALNRSLNKDDIAVIGFDLKKNPVLIANAYNDKDGVTRAFNLNLLNRINSELEGDFDLSHFDHYPVYDPITGEAKSYLISTINQSVKIKKLELTFNFYAGEPIHTEISKKFAVSEIKSLAEASGFKIKDNFFDCRHYFVNSIWIKN